MGKRENKRGLRRCERVLKQRVWGHDLYGICEGSGGKGFGEWLEKDADGICVFDTCFGYVVSVCIQIDTWGEKLKRYVQ